MKNGKTGSNLIHNILTWPFLSRKNHGQFQIYASVSVIPGVLEQLVLDYYDSFL